MKGTPIATLVLALCCTCAVCGAQIGNVALEGCRAAQQGRSDKTEVAAFLSKILEARGMGGLNPLELMEFRWVDLAGDGGCELVFTTWGAAVSHVNIEWQDSSQVLLGEASLVSREVTMGGKKKAFESSIRDLNGDGKEEIIVSSYLDSEGRLGAGPVWPQVYRVQGEKYVPASRDFPEFYDQQVLPGLDKAIAKTPQAEETVVAALEMERDKITRVLGRDPNAGLGEARQWSVSGNPVLVGYAVDVFRDIGGHASELKAAEEALKQARQRQQGAAQYSELPKR